MYWNSLPFQHPSVPATSAIHLPIGVLGRSRGHHLPKVRRMCSPCSGRSRVLTILIPLLQMHRIFWEAWRPQLSIDVLQRRLQMIFLPNDNENVKRTIAATFAGITVGSAGRSRTGKGQHAEGCRTAGDANELTFTRAAGVTAVLLASARRRCSARARARGPHRGCLEQQTRLG